MVYSASAVIAVQENHSQFHYVMKQGIWTLIGFGAMFVMMRFDYQLLNRAWIVYGLLLVTIVLLLAVFAFPPINGARRWIKFSGFSMQPSELAKLSLAIFVAYFIQRRAGEEESFWKTFLPCMFVLGIVAGARGQGTRSRHGADACDHRLHDVLSRAACAPRHMLIATVPALLFVGNMLIFTPFRMKRLAAFIDPWADAQGTGYQVVQSLIAVGSGGQNGLGFAQGRQKLLFLPFAHSDFIFAVIGEELGLIGALIVVIVFAVFLWRGMRAALRAPDRFGMLLGIGIVVGIVAQALLNMSVVLALLPTKGIPLPFISYGGSSLVPTLAARGNPAEHFAVRRTAAAARHTDDGDYEEDWRAGALSRKKRPVVSPTRGVARAR